jgi:hypothetical protein
VHSTRTPSCSTAHTLKSSPFWSCSRIASICHWLRPSIICCLNVATDGQSDSLSWCRIPIWASTPILLSDSCRSLVVGRSL